MPFSLQYLEENVHKTYVDVSDMARVLQERYRAEYGRRKMAPFRQLVEQGLLQFLMFGRLYALGLCLFMFVSIQNGSTQLRTGQQSFQR